MKYTWCER